MDRDAIPLNPRSYAAMHDAAIEEIHQGSERYGIPVLLDLHTGLRRRLLVHYDDSWRESTENGDQIRTPKQEPCTIKDDGCTYCNKDKSRGPDGFIRPKTGQGEKRTIPIFETWYDTYNGGERDTELKKWLDHWFRTRDAGWGYERGSWKEAVYTVAQRRHDELVKHHQGAVERSVRGRRQIVPHVMGHDLRASFATQCLRCLVDDTTIMDWCGWKNPQMLNHYRGFVGDADGSQRESYNNGGDELSTTDLIQLMAKEDMLNPEKIDEEALKTLTDQL